ncbi:MAG: hypothetical protein KatS3mg085_217 [Candidatus Dojkabacteria bacterium]|nr:MAG: hypothetical protein KatS3mg085_217 [Candidatus Dojkabacteria bacterium]
MKNKQLTKRKVLKIKNEKLVKSAEIVSAYKLDDEVVENLVKIFKLDKSTLTIKVDKNVIGGIIVRRGSDVYDGSVKSQLQNLKKMLFESLKVS